MNFKLTQDNNFDLSTGNLQKIKGADEIAQILSQKFQSFRGEWFLNLDLGLPYFQELLEKATSISAIENTYIDMIINTPGVLDILTFRLDFTPSTREAAVSFRVKTSDGLLNFNQGVVTSGNI